MSVVELNGKCVYPETPEWLSFTSVQGIPSGQPWLDLVSSGLIISRGAGEMSWLHSALA